MVVFACEFISISVQAHDFPVDSLHRSGEEACLLRKCVMKHPQTRRTFLTNAIMLTGGLSTGVVISAESRPATYKAAVIGYTGRGDYGHGLDEIFSNRKNIELVA